MEVFAEVVEAIGVPLNGRIPNDHDLLEKIATEPTAQPAGTARWTDRTTQKIGFFELVPHRAAEAPDRRHGRSLAMSPISEVTEPKACHGEQSQKGS